MRYLFRPSSASMSLRSCEAQTGLPATASYPQDAVDGKPGPPRMAASTEARTWCSLCSSFPIRTSHSSTVDCGCSVVNGQPTARHSQHMLVVARDTAHTELVEVHEQVAATPAVYPLIWFELGSPRAGMGTPSARARIKSGAELCPVLDDRA